MCQAFSVKRLKIWGSLSQDVCSRQPDRPDLVKLDRDGTSYGKGLSSLYYLGVGLFSTETRDSGFIIAGSTDDARSLLLIKPMQTEDSDGRRYTARMTQQFTQMRSRDI